MKYGRTCFDSSWIIPPAVQQGVLSGVMKYDQSMNLFDEHQLSLDEWCIWCFPGQRTDHDFTWVRQPNGHINSHIEGEFPDNW